MPTNIVVKRVVQLSEKCSFVGGMEANVWGVNIKATVSIQLA